MFEEGKRLVSIYGPENVYDFTLGNPFGEPPVEVQKSIEKHVLGGEPGLHKYMSNAGFLDVREKLAKHLEKESGISLNAQNIIMTVGSAGGMNVVFKAILNPGDEVIAFAPYFVEYNFYADNHGGKLVVIPANIPSFQPNLEELEKHINEKTKAIIINSPNNPSGVIYSEEILKRMSAIIEAKEKEYGTTIFIVSDEPYSKLVYDGAKVPSNLRIFKNSIVVDSYSKSLGLSGERIGYIACSSNIENVVDLTDALTFCNRILGFINAPALFQKVIGDTLDVKLDVADYKAKRDYLYENLTRLGFECANPQGGFYLFVKSLIPEDTEFVKRALKHNILFVAGTGFGCPGYVRIAYCVELDMIKNSIPAFEALAKEFR